MGTNKPFSRRVQDFGTGCARVSILAVVMEQHDVGMGDELPIDFDHDEGRPEDSPQLSPLGGAVGDCATGRVSTPPILLKPNFISRLGAFSLCLTLSSLYIDIMLLCYLKEEIDGQFRNLLEGFPVFSDPKVF